MPDVKPGTYACVLPKIKLWSSDGQEFVAEVSCLPFKHWPELLMWGQRFFVKRVIAPSTPPAVNPAEPFRYCEALGFAVVGLEEMMRDV